VRQIVDIANGLVFFDSFHDLAEMRAIAFDHIRLIEERVIGAEIIIERVMALLIDVPGIWRFTFVIRKIAVDKLNRLFSKEFTSIHISIISDTACKFKSLPPEKAHNSGVKQAP